MFPNNPFISGSLDAEIDYLLLDLDDKDSVQCECGSDSVYGKNFQFHSFWCPKYVNNV